MPSMGLLMNKINGVASNLFFHTELEIVLGANHKVLDHQLWTGVNENPSHQIISGELIMRQK